MTIKYWQKLIEEMTVPELAKRAVAEITSSDKAVDDMGDFIVALILSGIRLVQE